jgi:hypothetical protein
LLISGEEIDLASDPETIGKKKAHFLHRFNVRTIILPRQARDKHGESSKRDAVFLAAIAQRTVFGVNDINHYRPVNSLAMAWPPASRIVNSSTFLLDRYQSSGA